MLFLIIIARTSSQYPSKSFCIKKQTTRVVRVVSGKIFLILVLQCRGGHVADTVGRTFDLAGLGAFCSEADVVNPSRKNGFPCGREQDDRQTFYSQTFWGADRDATLAQIVECTSCGDHKSPSFRI